MLVGLATAGRREVRQAVDLEQQMLGVIRKGIDLICFIKCIYHPPSEVLRTLHIRQKYNVEQCMYYTVKNR